MTGKNILAALAAVLFLGQPALAATSLCVEDASTGFRWENGKWRQTTWNTSSYVIRRADVDEEGAGGCYYAIQQEGRSLTPEPFAFLNIAHGCYFLTNLGEGELAADDCTEYSDDDGAITSVSCTTGGSRQYAFQPAGEFYVSYTGSITAGTNETRKPDQQRMSAFMSVGKCSVISP